MLIKRVLLLSPYVILEIKLNASCLISVAIDSAMIKVVYLVLVQVSTDYADATDLKIDNSTFMIENLWQGGRKFHNWSSHNF